MSNNNVKSDSTSFASTYTCNRVVSLMALKCDILLRVLLPAPPP